MTKPQVEKRRFKNTVTAWSSRNVVNLTAEAIDRLLYGVLLIKAVALALHEVPELNSFWKDEKLNLCTDINVGVAISLRQGGLVVPA